MFDKKDQETPEDKPFQVDLEKGQSQHHRETYSAPQFFSSTTTRRMPPSQPPSPLAFANNNPVDMSQFKMYVPAKKKRERPDLGSLEIQGYMPPTNSDHADSPKLVRDLLNKGNSLPPSARGDNFRPEDHGFEVTYGRQCGSSASTPVATTPSPLGFACDREWSRKLRAWLADHVDDKDGNTQDQNDPEKGFTEQGTQEQNSTREQGTQDQIVQNQNTQEHSFQELGTRENLLQDQDAQEHDMYEDMAAYEQDEDGYINEPVSHTASIPAIPANQVARDDPSADPLEEFAWSPRNSEDSDSMVPALNISPTTQISERFNTTDELEDDISDVYPEQPSPSGSGDTMALVDLLDSISLDSRGSSSDLPADSTPPFLDVEIPGGAFDSDPSSDPLSSSQHAPSMGSQNTSSIVVGRFSGIISDGSSQRPMSLCEIENSLQSIGELGQLVISEGKGTYFSKSSQNKGNLTIDGPGTSQTSSSLGRGGPSGEAVGASFGIESDRGFVPTVRSPTPNLLWGSRALKTTDNDWETVSDLRGNEDNATGRGGSEAQTESSLADNSDIGEVPLPQRSGLRHRDSNPRYLTQHSTRPRANKAFVLVKDRQTGRIECVPQSQFEGQGRVLHLGASNNALASVNTTPSEYRHPAPLATAHPHPFRSSPPTIRSIHLTAPSIENDRSAIRQQAAFTNSSSSAPASNIIMAANNADQDTWEALTTSDRKSYDSVEEASRGRVRDDKGRSVHSSAWLSTVSEGNSGELSLPDREGSFAKFTVLGKKGNITGTPEGTGAREVGSSLADASSQGANFSSPTPFGSSPFSPTQQPEVTTSTPPKAYGYDTANNSPFSNTSEYAHADQPASINPFFPTAQYARPYKSATGNPFATPQISTTSLAETGGMRSFDPTTDGVSIEMHERGYPAARKVHGQRMESPHRRRRSSSESEGRVKTSPSAQTSGLPSAMVKGHKHRNTTTSLLLRETYTRSTSEVSRDEAAAVAPSPEHPAYNVRTWDSFSAHTRPTPRPSPYARPVARAESPHLYRIPREPTGEVLARQEQASFWCLVLVCVVPPFALLYGHGHMDGLVRWYTADEIPGFGEWYKLFAMCWGYGATGVVIIAIVIAMLVLSF